MANLFKFELVPNGLQVTEYHSYGDYADNINGTDCGIYTKGSTIEFNDGQYILKDGNDAVIFTAYEIVDLINGSPYFYYPDEEAILEAFKGIINSGITDNQSFNIKITEPYLARTANNVSFQNAFYPTVNVIDNTENITNIYFNSSFFKSINVYTPGINGDLDFGGNYLVESITLPIYFNTVYAYRLVNLKEVYLYNGLNLAPNNTLDLSLNALSQESVDRVLRGCVEGNQYDRYLYLDGGNNASPSAAGLLDAAILISRGWDVYYN